MNTASDIFQPRWRQSALRAAHRRAAAAARSQPGPLASRCRQPPAAGPSSAATSTTSSMPRLQPEPERRYASVEKLEEDLRNWLADRPVSATGDFVVVRRLALSAPPPLDGGRPRRRCSSSILAGSAACRRASGASRAERRFQQLRQLGRRFRLSSSNSRSGDIAGATQARPVRGAHRDRLPGAAGRPEAKGDSGCRSTSPARYRRISEIQYDPGPAAWATLAGARRRPRGAASCWIDPGGESPAARGARAAAGPAERSARGQRPAGRSLDRAMQAQRLADELLREDAQAAATYGGWVRAGERRRAARRAAEGIWTGPARRGASPFRWIVSRRPMTRRWTPRCAAAATAACCADLTKGRGSYCSGDRRQREANDVLRRCAPLRPPARRSERNVMVGQSLLGSLLLLRASSRRRRGAAAAERAWLTAERRRRLDAADAARGLICRPRPTITLQRWRRTRTGRGEGVLEAGAGSRRNGFWQTTPAIAGRG